MQTTLVAAGTKVYLAVDWKWTSILNAWGVFIEGCSETGRSSWLSRERLNNSLPRSRHLFMQWIHISQYVTGFKVSQ
jgi:hypothetical protein